MKNSLRDLGNLAAEVEGISSEIGFISLFVGVNGDARTDRGTPTQETIDATFYAVTEHLSRIARTLSELEVQALSLEKAGSLTA